MPVYEYRCHDCEKAFEIVESVSEHEEHKPEEVKCPACGKENVERLWSHVVAVTSKKS